LFDATARTQELCFQNWKRKVQKQIVGAAEKPSDVQVGKSRSLLTNAGSMDGELDLTIAGISKWWSVAAALLAVCVVAPLDQRV
jgi:hypothetical protein